VVWLSNKFRQTFISWATSQNRTRQCIAAHCRPRPRCLLRLWTDDEVTHQSNYKRMFLPTPTTPCSAGPAWTGSYSRLVLALILSRLDYCNAILAGLPPLQRVMHAAGRVIYDLKPYDHVTPALKALHWRPIKQRIEFKLWLLVHLAIKNKAPVYLQNLLTTTASVSSRVSNRSASNCMLWIMAIFEHKHFTRYCSDAFDGWSGILLSLYFKFTAKSVVKEFWKSISIWQSSKQKYSGTFNQTSIFEQLTVLSDRVLPASSFNLFMEQGDFWKQILHCVNLLPSSPRSKKLKQINVWRNCTKVPMTCFLTHHN